MNLHFSILPLDVVQYLTQALDSDGNLEKPLRILRLPHPRTGLPSLFLPLEWLPPSNPQKSSALLEIQAVCPPDERSWILGEEVVADGKLLTMTPIDPVFLLLPILQATQPTDGSTAQFRTADDLLDECARKLASSNDSSDSLVVEVQSALDFCSLRCTRESLTHLCDVKEISPEITVYRFSHLKFRDYMRAKVARLEKSNAFDASRTTIRSLAKDGLMEDGREDLLQLGRIRACCDLVSQYLSSNMRDELINLYDFTKLQAYLNANAEEAVAKATADSSKPPKKVAKEAPNKSGSVDNKKRKPAKPSQGVEKLKKASTAGMAKLSSFFNKSS
ncbi:ribonuclease H2, subunit B [Gymnopilus junonius]|uniref:Ribonuclease H2 subunit B n=1 Tax=Gymnopilus junonius TaxID=109634 RepID=A0A9P5TQC9_GYMJU|nr:ribonuclease H2, subunit B [Gymnopilus junonius]